jgi:hypothetical protein
MDIGGGKESNSEDEEDGDDESFNGKRDFIPGTDLRLEQMEFVLLGRTLTSGVLSVECMVLLVFGNKSCLDIL